MGEQTTQEPGSLPSPGRRVVRLTKHVRVQAGRRGLNGDIRAFALDALKAGRHSQTRPAWTFWGERSPTGWRDFQTSDLYLWDAGEDFCLVLSTAGDKLIAKTCLRRRVAAA